MTTFAEHEHSRTTGGRFTTKDHPEADLDLEPLSTTLLHATGRWASRSHDQYFRPVTAYFPAERTAAALRTRFGAAPEALVDGEYVDEQPGRGLLQIHVESSVGLHFRGPTRQAAEANMLSALERMAGTDIAWRRADLLNEEGFGAVFHDHATNRQQRRALRPPQSIEDAEEGYQRELTRLHQGLAGTTTPSPIDLDAAVRCSYAELVDSFAPGTQVTRILLDSDIAGTVRHPVAGHSFGRCYAAAQVLNRNEDPKTTAMTAVVLEGSVHKQRPWSQVRQRSAMDAGEHRIGSST